MPHEYKQQLLMKCEKAKRGRRRGEKERKGGEGEGEGEGGEGAGSDKKKGVAAAAAVAVRWVNREDVVWRRCLRISEGDGEAEGKNNQRLSATAGILHFDTETKLVSACCGGFVLVSDLKPGNTAPSSQPTQEKRSGSGCEISQIP